MTLQAEARIETYGAPGPGRAMTRPWEKLYNALSAVEAIGVCSRGPGLNARGERILRYLQSRRRRAS